MSRRLSPTDDVPFVSRSALQRKLARGRFGRATVIHAPAGYGKTHLLNQWAAGLVPAGVKVIRLHCDAQLRSPARFFGTLTSLIVEAGGDPGRADTVGKARDRGLETFAGSLLAKLGQSSEERVIIIDSYEAAASEGVDKIVAELVRSAPSGVHFAIASRVQPDLGLSPERMTGEITVLNLPDLCFTDDEIGELFPSADPEFVARLSVMTEGWPFAVHLAALHAGSLGGALCSADTLITSDEDLGEFISDAMLRNLPAEHCQLLLETSFFPTLDADLVEAVTGLPDAWQKLADLKRANVVTPTGGTAGQHLRCHPLIRAHLYRELRSRGWSQMEPPLRRAVAHFCARGDYKSAARYARNLRDTPLSIGIFLESGAILLNSREGHEALQDALDQLPREALHHPRVRAAKACVLAKRGQPEIARLMLDDIDLDGLPDAEAKLARRDLNIAMLTTVVYSAQGLRSEDWERYTPLRVGPEREIATVEGFYYNLRWGIDFNDCALDRALIHGKMSAHHYAAADAKNGGGHIHIHLARTLTELGRLNEAKSHLAEARTCFAASSDFGALAIADIFEARCEFLLGQVTGVDAKVGPALRTLLEGEHYWEPLAVAYGLLADIAHILGKPAEALKQLGDGMEFARKRNMLHLEAVLNAKLTMLLATRNGGDVECDQNLPHPDTLQLRDQAQWLERFLHRRLKAHLLVKEGQFGAAADVLADAEADARAASLACVEMKCLLDHVFASEAAGDRAGSLGLLTQAVQLGARTGLAGPFLLHSKTLLPLLVHLLNDPDVAREPDPKLFIRHIISQSSGLTASSAAIFSPREKAILELLASAKCNKEMARELGISPETVRFHLKRIYEKLGMEMGYHNRKFVREIILNSNWA